MKKLVFFFILCCAFTFRSYSQNDIESYEYWFDNDYNSHITIGVAPTSYLNLNSQINISGISLGMHIFNIRFKDSNNRYSSAISQFFNVNAASNAISYYQYWFDDNFTDAVTLSINPQTQYSLITNIDASALNNGMHRIHIRFREEGENWSLVVSNFFQKSGNGISLLNEITAYRYWLDSISAPITNINLVNPTNPFEIIQQMDMTNVPKGNHVLNIQFKDTTGQWSAVLSESFVKNALPIALFNAQSTNICLGDSIVFSNQSFDADSFLWDFGDGNISHDFEPIHYYAQSGNYNVFLKAIDVNSGLDSTLFINNYINVFGDAHAQFNYSAAVNVVNFNNSSSGASNYTWNFGDGTASTSTANPVHTYNANGSYLVTLVASNMCDSDTITQNILIEGLGIEDFNEIKEFNQYPNPFNGKFLINFQLNEKTNVQMGIFDLTGNEVISINNGPLFPGKHNFEVNSEKLANGMYLLKINSNKKEKCFKIVKAN